MATHTFKTLMRRLARAGFKGDFVRSAILPDWWEDDCADDEGLLPEVELRVARFLGMSVTALRDASAEVAPQLYPSAKLRRVRDVDKDLLAPAIHAAIRIASAATRSLRDDTPTRAMVPPADGTAWRAALLPSGGLVSLDVLLDDLWSRGIPVVPIDLLPAPSFQGLVCICEGRPVIVVGHKHDEPGRIAHLLAHEAGHVAAGDCEPDQPVVDTEEIVLDDTEIEVRADAYAAGVLVGSGGIPVIDGRDFRSLAKLAGQHERSSGVDAGATIFAWARRTGDYAVATMAVKALYRHTGARRKLRTHFDRHVDIDGATESDRALLRCIYGGSARDATAA